MIKTKVCFKDKHYEVNSTFYSNRISEAMNEKPSNDVDGLWVVIENKTLFTICSLGSKPCGGPGGRPSRSRSSGGSPGCGYKGEYCEG